MRLVFDPALRGRFPDLTAHLVELRDLTVRERDERLDAFVDVLVAEVRRDLDLAFLKDEPILRAYRDFYWRIGIDPTKIRPASEALLRRVLLGKALPRINTLVDAYNLASMKSRVAIAAFDRECVGRDLLMRLAREGERFLGIGMSEPVFLRGHEVVVQDPRDLVAIYPYRDADATKVTLATKHVLLMTCGVPGLAEGKLGEADAITKEFVQRFCGP